MLPAAMCLVALLIAGGTAAAQGHAHAAGASDGITSSPATPESRSIYLGSWLDDASALEPSAVWGAVSLVRLPGGQIDFPVVDVAFGATRNVQAGLSVPVAHADGLGTSVGDSFFYTKFVLRDPSTARNGFGAALAPVVQIAQTFDTTSSSVSVGLPLNLELRRGDVRTYGSMGVFTRGAIFASGAVEFTASPRYVVTATIGRTHATVDAADPSIGRDRTDVGLGLSVRLPRNLAAYTAFGQSSTLAGSGGWVATGISLYVKGR